MKEPMPQGLLTRAGCWQHVIEGKTGHIWTQWWRLPPALLWVSGGRVGRRGAIFHLSIDAAIALLLHEPHHQT